MDQPPKPKKSKGGSQIFSLRGMRDFLPTDFFYRDKIEKTAQRVATSFGYQRIDTPILEPSALFERTIGEGTDIVEKEMYSFLTKGKDKVTLRPEFTASVVRAFVENGMKRWPKPVKLFTTGPLFRYERPQEGRYREHHQLDFEVFGREDSLLDAQVILLAGTILKKLGIKNQKLLVNSIGCPACRKPYLRLLVKYLESEKRKLCEDCKRRIKTNPLRVLDCKEASCRTVLDKAPQMINSLCEACHQHFKGLLEYLDELELTYLIDSSLVRGLDYYNRTVFEFVPEAEPGERPGSLAGGGRYDGLVKQLGGGEMPAVGFGMGIERLMRELKKQNPPVKTVPANLVFLIQLGELGRKKSLKLYGRLLEAGLPVAESFGKGSIKGQLKSADKSGAKLALIIGQKEALDGTVILRDLRVGSQEVVPQEKVINWIKKLLKK